MQSPKLVQVSEAQKGEIPISKHTAYKWHSEKKHPRLVFKVCGKLFFDLGEWALMVEEAREGNVKKAYQARRELNS